MPDDILILANEIADLTTKVAELQKEIAEKSARLKALAGAPVASPAPEPVKPAFAQENPQAYMVAVKFKKEDPVYTYKATVPGLMIGEIVAAPRQGSLAIAAVVGVDTKPATVYENNPVITMREGDIPPAEITPKMREEYRALLEGMRDPMFFDIGIPSEPTPADRYAVAVRFMNGLSNRQEYTYVTDNRYLKEGDILVAPSGAFNLPSKVVFVRYTEAPRDNNIKLKRIYCPLRDYERIRAGNGV